MVNDSKMMQNDINGNVSLSQHPHATTNGHVSKANGTANGTTNGTANGIMHQQQRKQQQKPTFFGSLRANWDVFADFSWFIICSIGFIILELYYMASGYPQKELKNDIALITGGGNGLGRLLAERLGKMGTKVVVWDINKEGIKETVNIVQEAGGYCKGYTVDISKKEEVYKAAEVIKNEVGDVTLLINNAGVVSGFHLLDTPDHLIERSFNVNVMAHFWTTKAFLPKMIEKQRGHITTIASMAGHVGITKLVDYCASKFAAVGFDEALRLELDVLGHTNIQTTCICPFFIQATGMFDDVNARWVPTLNPNEVANRVIEAIQKNEKIAILPGFLKYIMGLKWIFPWGCTAGFLRRLVPDAAPHAIAHKMLAKQKMKQIEDINGFTKTSQVPETFNNFINSNTINTPIATITTTTPTAPNTNINTNLNTNRSKSASLLIQRTPSLGERVL